MVFTATGRYWQNHELLWPPQLRCPLLQMLQPLVGLLQTPSRRYMTPFKCWEAGFWLSWYLRFERLHSIKFFLFHSLLKLCFSELCLWNGWSWYDSCLEFTVYYHIVPWVSNERRLLPFVEYRKVTPHRKYTWFKPGSQREIGCSPSRHGRALHDFLRLPIYCCRQKLAWLMVEVLVLGKMSQTSEMLRSRHCSYASVMSQSKQVQSKLKIFSSWTCSLSW